MFRHARANLPFRARFRSSRGVAAGPSVSLPPAAGARPHTPTTLRPILAALVSGVGFLACAESAWEPEAPDSGGVRPAEAVVSETSDAFADGVELPDWKTVIRGMTTPGCVLHFRLVTGSYVARTYAVEYSRAALMGARNVWRPLVYNVPVVVTRPTADGGTETLPERLAIRGVCLMPRTALGTAEAVGRVEGVLQALGIIEARRVSDDTAAAVPRGDASSGKPTVPGRDREPTSPPPPGPAQDGCSVEQAEEKKCAIPLDELVTTGTPTPIPISCPAGFDYDGSTNSCKLTANLGGTINPGNGNNGNSGGGNTGEGENTGPKTVDFTLSCSAPTRGATASCSVSAPDSAGVSMGSLKYSWSSMIGNATVATKQNGGSSWSGTATENVNVKVEITDPAGGIAAATRSAAVSVSGRNWTWPEGEDLGEWNDSIPDSCFGNAMGLTVGRMGVGSCSGYFLDYLDGFAVSSGSGPWEDRWYVASADSVDSVAGAFWGANPEIRSNGPAYDTGTLLASIRRQRGCRSSANVHTVNACSSNEKTSNDRSAAFVDLVEEVEDHEADHVSAVVTEAGEHDVWGDWEAVVTASESGAKTMAQTAASAVQAALLSATQAVDTGYTARTFDVWWWTGSEWARRGIRTGH